MSIRSLPERPNLDQLRRQAKELRDAVRAADEVAEERVRPHLHQGSGTSISLYAAQLVIAREHGFSSWPVLKAEVEARTMSPEQLVDAFLAASIDREPGRAVRLLERDPQVASRDLDVAEALRRHGAHDDAT